MTSPLVPWNTRGYLGFKVQTIPPADTVERPPPEVDRDEVPTVDQPAPAVE